jgi:hypothetical protein
MSNTQEIEWTEEEQRHHQEFFYTLGLTVVGWQYVELNLFLIFARLMRSQHGMAMSAAYHSVINLQARLAMIDSMAQVMLENKPSLLRQWGLIHKRVKERSARRNDLVHLVLMGTSSTDLRLETPFLDTRAKKKINIDLKQIKEISDSFRRLSLETDVFLNNLSKAIKPPSIRKSRALTSGQS